MFFLDDTELTPAQSAAAIECAAAGRGFLALHIGGPDSRRTLFRRGLRGHHVIVALCDGQYAGFASYKHRRMGPMLPQFSDFIRTFGRSAIRPWLVYHLAERRLRSRGLYVCGIEVLDEFKRRGVGSALITKLAHIARDLDASVVELDVKASKHEVRAFYRACNFTPPDYPLLSFDRINVAMSSGFQRLALAVAPGSN